MGVACSAGNKYSPHRYVRPPGMLLKFTHGAWLASIALQLVLGIVLLAKRIWRYSPVFTVYALFSLLQAMALYSMYSIRSNAALYIYVYCACEALGCLLGIGVIYEIYRFLLTNYPTLHTVASTAIQSAIALLVGASLSMVYFHAPVEGSRLVAGFVVLEQATRIVEVGLLMFLFTFSRVFGLHWRQAAFGIALGLGLFTTVELAGITMRSYFGITAAPIFGIVRSLSFNASMLIWIGYLLAPEKAVTTSELPKRAQLEQWNQAIMELINK